MPTPAKAPSAPQGEPGQAGPAISLPKGGGAIRGIGEKFGANPVTGTGSMSVPLATSPARAGFGPQLALSYDSGAGNGPFGFGWSLGLPVITRKTDKGLPRYLDAEESDVYVLSGADDLVPMLEPDGTRSRDATTAPGFVIDRYRPRIEGMFARIERWTETASGAIHWRTITRDNVTTLYGRDATSRISDAAAPSSSAAARTFGWLICESTDDKGNAIVYKYQAEDDSNVDQLQSSERNRARAANRYLKRVLYGNRVSTLVEPDLGQASWMFEVVFDYDEGHCEELPLDPSLPAREQHRFVRASSTPARPWAVRPDPFSSYRAGFEVRTYRRCHRVLMFHHFPDLPTGDAGYDGLVSATIFDYADFDYSQPAAVSIEDELAYPGSTRVASFVRAVHQAGYVRDETQPVATYLERSLPPVELEYSQAVIDDRVREIDAASLEGLPAGLDGTSYRFVDLDGEGISGILTEQAGAWFYKPGLGEGQFGSVQTLRLKPSLAALSGGRQQLLDLAGDGQLDLVDLAGPTSGFYERTTDRNWEPFRSFRQVPNVAWDDGNLRFVDLDGDGHADVLVAENEVFTWYPARAEEGFGPAVKVRQPRDEERGPRVVFADGEQSIYLADMSGDSLTDLVRIRNGEICYWPNLGYGRFGAKVTMDHAPWLDHPDQFDQRRIRLADIDGSGTTDIIYLARDGARLYFNQAGNRWSGPRRLAAFPPVDDLSSVMTADLLGIGTACLVWSSALPGDARRPLRYVDLMGGQKPHLLVRSVNNLGSETRVGYAPSTRFYLADQRAGKPWVTRLPFPVHVLERVETIDHVSRNRFVTRYTYHHGYFDGVEREFRGFGMVEQLDTEELATLTGDGELGDTSNLDAASYVPPVLTKTWFHTGIYLGRDHVSDFFAGLLDPLDEGEYYREPGLTDAAGRALLVEDTRLPDGLTVDEEREACRSLKGSMLRQEVYALDGSARAPHPFTVTEQNLTVRVLQRRGDNRHAVFLTHGREVLTTHYEREPTDPRVGHALTLEVDDFGNVLKSAAIGYGRREPDPTLAPGDQAKQTQLLATYAESRFTNDLDGADAHRAPALCEARTYELTGLTLPPGRARFELDEVLAAGAAATELGYDDAPTPGALERRLIEHVRTLYRRDDLIGALPLGIQESLALPFESHKLALTPGLVSGVYGGRVTNAMLAEGGYVHSEGDPTWWIPSGQAFYSPDPAATPAEELAFAREHFFLPHRTRDPFHTSALSTESFVTYDAFDLLVQEARDAVGNRVTVGERHADPTQPPVRLAYDYRVLKPRLVMDANRNRAAVVFDALGMVAGTAVMGKPEESPAPGDRLGPGFRADLTEAEIEQLLTDPTGPAAAALLDDATSRTVHDLSAFWRATGAGDRPPVAAVTVTRETHVGEPAHLDGTRLQVSLSYSDGFGREIQKKVQAEPGRVPVRGPDGHVLVDASNQPVMSGTDVDPRWVGSGWTVFNNKGKPVRQYEPFFTDTHRFELDVRIGVSPVLFYDPVGRVVATLLPDHTWQKVVFDPWREETWDVNDTVLLDPLVDETAGPPFARLPAAEVVPTWHAQRAGGTLGADEQDAATKAEMYAGTPQVVHADALGRAVLTIQHNRYERNGTIVEERYATRVTLDIEGNQRSVTDDEDRVVERQDFDVLGKAIHQASMEAGARWTLTDVAGKPLYAWDSRGHQFRTAYDQIRRPVETILRSGGGPEQRIARTTYGEALPQPEAANLRGQAVEVGDQAGVVRRTAFDFKGNVLRSERQLALEYRATLDWSVVVDLEVETFVTETAYDALNRPTAVTTPDQSVHRCTFNEAGFLERLDVNLRGAVNATPFVRNIDYDAKGQRLRVERGNGVTTEYTYDPLSFRLRTLATTRASDGAALQELSYTYDPLGNITRIRDDAQQTIFFANQIVRPDNDYTYDAIYRLVVASGREHVGQASQPETTWDDRGRVGLPLPGEGQAMRPYSERYEYDAVGNFKRLVHVASSNGNWTRVYDYDEPSLLELPKRSNRLSRTTVGNGSPEIYGHDAHGNMVSLPHLTLMAWDFKDQLQATARHSVTSGSPETTYYVYDADGQRVRKVTERANGVRKSERIYLGAFETYRERDGSGALTLERETLHITDEKSRIALLETRTHGDDGSPEQLHRHQLQNHLGSACLEVDGQARIISYEEFAPFGSTTFQAAHTQTQAPKRYRFTGMERDDETGLSYHSKRYCIVWLGRWASSDPLGISDGVNTYAYVRNQPTSMTDTNGTEGKLWQIGVCRVDDPPPLRVDPRIPLARPSTAPQMRSGGQSDYRELPWDQKFKKEPSAYEKFQANMATNADINLLNVGQVLILEATGRDHRKYVQTTAPLSNALLAIGGAKALGNSAPQLTSSRPQVSTSLRWIEAQEAASFASRTAQPPPVKPMGPMLGKSGAFTKEEFADQFFERYQRYANEGYGQVMTEIASGRRPLDPTMAAATQIGSRVDAIARTRLRSWLNYEIGGENATTMAKVNRFLRDPSNLRCYRIPDARTPGHIFDLTIGTKTVDTPQIQDFFNFSGGSRITIVRPEQVGGSYSILPGGQQ